MLRYRRVAAANLHWLPNMRDTRALLNCISLFWCAAHWRDAQLHARRNRGTWRNRAIARQRSGRCRWWRSDVAESGASRSILRPCSPFPGRYRRSPVQRIRAPVRAARAGRGVREPRGRGVTAAGGSLRGPSPPLLSEADIEGAGRERLISAHARTRFAGLVLCVGHTQHPNH